MTADEAEKRLAMARHLRDASSMWMKAAADGLRLAQEIEDDVHAALATKVVPIRPGMIGPRLGGGDTDAR